MISEFYCDGALRFVLRIQCCFDLRKHLEFFLVVFVIYDYTYGILFICCCRYCYDSFIMYIKQVIALRIAFY